MTGPCRLPGMDAQTASPVPAYLPDADEQRAYVLEDDPDIAALEADVLRDLGFSVVACSRIVELGDLMALALPHLLVVDVMLPDGDGGDITELLRRRRTGRWSPSPSTSRSSTPPCSKRSARRASCDRPRDRRGASLPPAR
jgi:CheY-like chemotaxis protein